MCIRDSLLSGGHKRIENDFALLALAGVERHDLQVKLVVELVRSRMFMDQLADERLLFRMRRDYADRWRRLHVEKLRDPVDDPPTFKSVDVPLIDKPIMWDLHVAFE